MAIDWSFDLFADVMDSVNALPMEHGVRPSANLSDAQKLAVYVKTAIKFADFDMYMYEEDCIKDVLSDMYFSDWYKDVFNQRPHFDAYLIGALCGIYGSEYDIARWTWGNDVIGEYKRMAREHRHALEDMARRDSMLFN